MSKIKICGLSRECDIDAVNFAKPDFIGFLLAQGYGRTVSPETAYRLKQRLDKNIKAVGVFVNNDIDFIISLVNSETIDIVQLHGDEGEDYIKLLRERLSCPIIKAVRVRSEADAINAERLPVDYLLLDTYTKGVRGGSGKSFDWGMIPKISKPYFLAGGINSDNILSAARVGAYCIDISSGVETDGKKDREKIIEAVNKVRSE